MKRNRIIYLVIFLIILFLGGCLSRSLTLQVRYDDVKGLKQGDAVYFEGNAIGQVEEIFYTEKGDYLVKVSIVPEFKNAATVDSKFYVESDPGNMQKRAVVIQQEKPGGKLLENGALVQGSLKPKYFDEILTGLKLNAGAVEETLRQALEELKSTLTATSQEMDAEMENTLEELSRQFQSFKEEVQKVPDSEEVKKLQDLMSQFVDEFNKAQKDVRDHIRDEVLPQLHQELERLRQQLQQEGREEEIQEMDHQVKEMAMV